MTTTVLTMVLLLVAGIATVIVGVALFRSQQQAGVAPVSETPQASYPETDTKGRKRIIDRSVFLALEMSRVDGAINELEMRAIEDFLTRNIEELGEGEAEVVVRRVLRATIHHQEASHAVKEIASLADLDHRELVIRMLIEVGRADGELADQELGFLRDMGQVLGVRPQLG